MWVFMSILALGTGNVKSMSSRKGFQNTSACHPGAIAGSLKIIKSQPENKSVSSISGLSTEQTKTSKNGTETQPSSTFLEYNS